jgi:hypothetical protein
MTFLPPPPSFVLVGRTPAERQAWVEAWVAAWGAAGAQALPTAAVPSCRDLLREPPTADEGPPRLCLLLGSDGDPTGPPGGDGTEAMVRQALQRAGWAHSVLRGPLAEQLDTARRAWRAAQREPSPSPTRWRHVCGRCGDGDCERALFPARDDGRHGPASTGG